MEDAPQAVAPPADGVDAWAEYDGTTVVTKVWNGRANLVALNERGPAGHIEGLSLRLYGQESHQWSLNFSNSASGALTPPVIGGFHGGTGEFFGQDTVGGRIVLVRFVIAAITAQSCHFEQAFSDGGGRTWEVNWIATDTRVSP